MARKGKGLPKRQLRIKNRLRFILFLLLILLPVITFFIQHTGRTETKWVEYQVGYGDTYWQLAREAQDNGYNADIRIIVDRMVERSGIKAHELKEGDTIWIPEVAK